MPRIADAWRVLRGRPTGRVDRSAAFARFVRAYTAAVVNRLNSDWKPASQSADQDVFDALEMTRGRARNLVQNNGYARKYVTLARMNVCGPTGFKFQADVREDDGTADAAANKILENGWEDWSLPENCTVTGMMSLRQVEDLLVRHLVTDGEFFAAVFYGRQYKHGMALQILEPDLLNERLNTKAENGNQIVMGIEFNGNRRPVAYYFKQSRPYPAVYPAASTLRDHIRIPAEQVFHVYDADRALQSRGISWFAPSMERLRVLSAYEDATLTKARAAALTGGYFKENGGEYTGQEQDENGNAIMPLEPGEWIKLPAGVEPVPVDPDFPAAAHESFVKGTLRGIASGLGVSYPSLAADLADVNYSSIRAGIVEERDFWRYVQEMVVERFLRRLYSLWLSSAQLVGTIPLPASKYEKFNRPVFTGRRWQWVDPQKDVEAELAAINAKIRTRTQIAAERGENVEETFREIAEENKLAEKYGLNLEGNTNNGQGNQGGPPAV